MVNTLNTGYGFWEPIVFVLAFILLGSIAYLIYSRGNYRVKIEGDKLKPFLSGNVEPRKEYVHVRGKHLYWGFTEALSYIYKKLEKMHDGDVRNYVLLFFLVLVILILVLLGGI